MMANTKHCAIYTRKSTDERLDMEFNTLDAQREACEAYITSQKADGWIASDDYYDDGGYSGGSLNRPALQKLLDDIRAGNINIVVVYKIDRLTRSLMDFSKLVEIFDEYGVTFVSVTQSFNTTTSMGRLTLNVLLSFAQFEREVSAERIRDKIRASKKKGMWVGGFAPLGYESIDKKLVPHPEDAKTARHLFDRYLALGCVAKLKKELDAQGIRTKKRITKKGRVLGDRKYSRGALYSILQNPVYIGKIRHKEDIYEGRHDGIIPQDIWEETQRRLADNSAAKRGHARGRLKNLLKGLLYDCDGGIYSPTYSQRSGKRYRYYISQNLLQYRDHPKGIAARLPAHEIEEVVTSTIQRHLASTELLCPILQMDQIRDITAIKYINDNVAENHVVSIVATCLEKITLNEDTLNITINLQKLRHYISECMTLNITDIHKGTHDITVAYMTRRAHKGAIVIETENSTSNPLNLTEPEVQNLVKGIVWRDEFFHGTRVKTIAARERLSQSGIRKIIMASFDI